MDGQGHCVSAPGKVLVAGGYLVTLRPHPGLVFSVSARLYAAVQPLPPPHPVLPSTTELHKFELVVESPQFRKSFRFVVSLLADATTSEPYLLLRNLYYFVNIDFCFHNMDLITNKQ
jgi:phosphomevalonate kinase